MCSDEFIKKASEFDHRPFSKTLIIFNHIKFDSHAPLYYLTSYFYSTLFGSGKSLRIISAIFSLLSLVVLYKLALLLFNHRTAIYATLIMALNPFHIWYAQEARGYAMAAFFSILMIYNLFWIIKNNSSSNKDWAFFAAVSILSIYTSYHSAFLFLTTIIIFYFKNNPPLLKKWVVAAVIVGFFVSLLILILPSQISLVKNFGWIHPPNFNAFLKIFHAFNLGYTSILPFYITAFIIFLFLFFSSFQGRKKQHLSFLATALLTPIILTILISRLFLSIYIIRQLFFLSPLYYLIAAYGLNNISNRFWRSCILFSLIIMMGASLLNYYGYPILSGKESWNLHFSGTFPKKKQEEILNIIKRERIASDIILTIDNYSQTMMVVSSDNETLSKTFLLFYPDQLNRIKPWFFSKKHLHKKISTISPALSRELFCLIPHHLKADIIKTDVLMNEAKPGRVWILFTIWYPYERPCDEIPLDISTIVADFKKEHQEERDGICLQRYDRKP